MLGSWYEVNGLKSGSFPVFAGFRAGLVEALEWPLLRWLKPEPSVQVFDPERLGGQMPSARYVAFCMPAERVLSFDQSLPDLPADALQQALALEVERASPFGMDSTAWGWRIVERREEGVIVRLALAAKGDVERVLAELPAALRTRTEVWTERSPPLCLQGYGEDRRLGAMWRGVALRTALLAAVVMGFFALAVTPFLQTRAVVLDAQRQYEQLGQSAAGAVAERDALLRVHEVGNAVRAHLQQQAFVLPMLEALAVSVPDSAYAVNLEQRGARVRLTGQGSNVSALVGKLGAIAEFSGLRTTSAITRVNEEGVERFSVEFQYQPAAGGES